jgi:hypothetical protein
MSFLSKSELSKLIAQGLLQETFTHATLGSFDISASRSLIAHMALTRRHCNFADVRMADGTGVTIDPFEYLISQREIDMARVGELTDKELDEPLIYAHCPPGSTAPGESHLLIDGIHRLVARKRRMMPDFWFYLLPLHMVPRVNRHGVVDVPWGEMDVREGVGLVRRDKP